MGGQPPQMPPGGGGSPLGQLGQKKSTPDSGAPLLQMIMTLLAGAGLKDFTGSITSLMKAGGGGAHHKASGAPPGQQPSKGAPPGGPMPPPNVAGGAPPPGPQGPGQPPGGAGGIPPELLQKLMAMLMGGQGAQQPPPQG